MKFAEGKEQEYEDWYYGQSEEYGKMCFLYAENWADLMEKEIENSKESPMDVIEDNAYRLSHDADVYGITGFMYGSAVSILSQCWVYGEELRKWHNKEYDYNGSGVANPAIITLNKIK